MERNKKLGDLHRAILDQDVNKFVSLAEHRPGLNPGIIHQVTKFHNLLMSDPCDSRINKVTCLIVAIKLGELVLCRYLIEEGADVNCGLFCGLGPLSIALVTKQYEIAELLIDSGANICELNIEVISPIHCAIGINSPVSIVKAFLLAGFPKDGIVFYRSSETTLTMRAIDVQNIPVLKFLLTQKVDVNFCSSSGDTPLNTAIFNKAPEIVKLLIENGANIEGNYKNDVTPLFLAVHIKDTAIIKILLDSGANVNRLFTPLTYAQKKLRIPCITAFQLAILNIHLPTAKLLLEYGANVNANSPVKNSTALHLAFAFKLCFLKENLENPYREIIQFLLKNGADLEAKDKTGLLPIHTIYWSKNWIALEECIRFGMELNKSFCRKNGSIFKFVITNKVLSLVELCLAFGADNSQKFRSESLYETAIRSDCPTIVKTLWEYYHPCDDVAIERIKRRNQKIRALLANQHLFIKGITNNDPETVKNAVTQGAEVKGCSKDIGYYLHYCSARGYTEIVEILLENGVAISILNSEGFTALHEACRSGHLEICKLLLRHGAVLNYRGPGGVTPRQLAQLAGHKDIITLLKYISRLFHMVSLKNSRIVKELQKIPGREDFNVYMNCVNCKGNTIIGEALKLGFNKKSENLMALKLKQQLI